MVANKLSLVVKNMYGFSDCEVSLPTGATLITGMNAVGKTNLSKIIAALVTLDGNPERFDQTWKKWYMKQNAQRGYAMLGDIKWDPSKSGVEASMGSAPMAHKHSVGLIDFVIGSKSVKERTAVWEGLIMPKNPRELIEPSWPLASKEKMEAVIEKVERSSWQDAFTVYEDRRRQAKQKWSQITGAGTYGVKKASNWTPSYWHPDLDSASEESLQADLVNARDDLTEMTSQSAISQSQISEAQNARDNLIPEAKEIQREHQDKLVELRNKKETCNGMLDNFDFHIDRLQKLINEKENLLHSKPSLHCPECNAGLELVQDGVLGVWRQPSKEKLAEAVTELDSMKESIEIGKSKRTEKQREIGEIQTAIEERQMKLGEITGSIKQLEYQAKMADSNPSSEVSYEKRKKAENLVSECQKKLESFQSMRAAHACNQTVLELDTVCDILGPSGVRTKHLQTVIDGMKEQLKEMVELAGWNDIDLSDDYMITSNGIPIVMCAESEKLKAQWLMQILSAVYAKDKWIVFDQADTLVGEWWEGLVKIVNSICKENNEMRILVCGSNIKVDGWNTVTLK